MNLMQARGRSRTLSKAMLLASTLAACGMIAGQADAAALVITTSGVISSGSDPTDLLGAGTDLTGDSYSLTVKYDDLGPSYFTDGSGTFASDIGDPLTGYVVVTVDHHSLFTALQVGTSASLVEDLYDLFATNNGNDAAGNFADVSQNLQCASTCVPYADLQTKFSYTLQPGDLGVDTYSFTNAGGTATVSFTGASTSLSMLVPEPTSWVLLGSGLLGLGLVVRRRPA